MAGPWMHASGYLKEIRHSAAESFVSCRWQHRLVRILNLYQNATTDNILLFVIANFWLLLILINRNVSAASHFSVYRSNAFFNRIIILLPFRAAILMTAPCLRRDWSHTLIMRRSVTRIDLPSRPLTFHCIFIHVAVTKSYISPKEQDRNWTH